MKKNKSFFMNTGMKAIQKEQKNSVVLNVQILSII